MNVKEKRGKERGYVPDNNELLLTRLFHVLGQRRDGYLRGRTTWSAGSPWSSRRIGVSAPSKISVDSGGEPLVCWICGRGRTIGGAIG